MYFYEHGDPKLQLSLSLKGVNIGMTLLYRWRSKKCEMLIVFCVERPSEAGAPLGWGDISM